MAAFIDIYQAVGAAGWQAIGGCLLLADLIAFMIVCATWKDGGAIDRRPRRRRPVRPRRRD